jgi:hypothetical protein
MTAPEKPPLEPLAYRPRQAARAIGVCERTLQLWTKAGDGPPFVRIGRAVLYPVDVLRAWLMAKTQAPRAQQRQGGPGAQEAADGLKGGDRDQP